MYLDQLPTILQNEDVANLALKALEMMKADDPALVIQWNDSVFNTVNGGRNNIAGQTKGSIINYITSNGGKNVENQNTIFMFQTGKDLTDCTYGFPAW